MTTHIFGLLCISVSIDNTYIHTHTHLCILVHCMSVDYTHTDRGSYVHSGMLDELSDHTHTLCHYTFLHFTPNTYAKCYQYKPLNWPLILVPDMHRDWGLCVKALHHAQALSHLTKQLEIHHTWTTTKDVIIPLWTLLSLFFYMMMLILFVQWSLAVEPIVIDFYIKIWNFYTCHWQAVILGPY